MNQYSRGNPRSRDGGFQGHRGGNPSQERGIDQVWLDPQRRGYLIGGYFDEAGDLRSEFLERNVVGELAREMGQARLTTHQLRRFFGHCRRIETRLRSGHETWSQVQADFLKLDAAAADAAGKKPWPKIPRIFHDFIQRNVAAVKSEKDFLHGFLPHFEALVGFASGQLKERN